MYLLWASTQLTCALEGTDTEGCRAGECREAGGGGPDAVGESARWPRLQRAAVTDCYLRCRGAGTGGGEGARFRWGTGGAPAACSADAGVTCNTITLGAEEALREVGNRDTCVQGVLPIH